MRWDEVEREFFILSALLDRLGKSFGALAASLHRERDNSRVTPTKRCEPPEEDLTGEPAKPANLFD